jgi:hypothetical protein
LPAERTLCYLDLQQKKAVQAQGSRMHIDPAECHPAMDYSEHQKTYKLFLKLSAVTVVGVVVLMALLAVFVV